jgi:hypothetical protein
MAFVAFLDCLKNGFDDEAEIADFLNLVAKRKDERFRKAWLRRSSEISPGGL